jgi:hypothetical protein
MIGHIELTKAEEKLAGKIVFDVLHPRSDYEENQKNGERAAALMEKLLKRNAIPEARLRYFADPEYNPNGRGNCSVLDLFCRNGNTAEDAVRNPGFLKYLHYFLYGADLPLELQKSFLEKAQHWLTRPTELTAFARSLVRMYNLPRHPQNTNLKDAFYQLALDSDCDEGLARSVRETVMRVK